MHRPWAEIDWDAARPEWPDIKRSSERARFEGFDLVGDAAARLIDELGKTHVNGGALLKRFRLVTEDSALHWFASRNRFGECDFIQVLLGSAAVREAMPELNVPHPLGRDLGFEESCSGTLTLDWELAAVLVQGGAYASFKGEADDAKRLCAAFTDELVTGRHKDFKVYRSFAAWSPWFCDIAWDTTWACIDMPRNEITVICVTDTD